MNPKNNQRLEQLQPQHYQQIHRHLQLVSMVSGEDIFRPGDRIKQVFFPITALLAIANEMRDGVSLDMALVGSEGAIGLLGLYDAICPYRVHVVHSGLAYRVSIQDLMPLAQAGTWVHSMYLQVSHQILGQIAAEATCAHFHGTPLRVARCLLTRIERTGQPFVEVTHQNLADALGVRREAVTHALLKLPGIAHHRHRIEVHDLAALAAASCDCRRALDESLTGQLALPFE